MKFLAPLLALVLVGCAAKPEPRVDAQLASEIEKIKAIDNHAHPVRPGNPPDNDFDALPVDRHGALSGPCARSRQDSPIVVEARQAIGEGG